jgi:hypothetical protein
LRAFESVTIGACRPLVRLRHQSPCSTSDIGWNNALKAMPAHKLAKAFTVCPAWRLPDVGKR